MKHLFLFLLVLGLTQTSRGQWTVLNSPTSNDLRDVEFLNDNYGVAVGDGGAIIKTTDGGTTWTTLNLTTDDLNAVALSGTDTIYVAGGGGLGLTVYRSTDGGASWQKVLIESTPVSLCTTSDGDVFAAANDIYHSQDAGETWAQPYILSPTVTAFSIQDVDDQTIHMGGNVGGIVTYSAIVARSVNGGNSFWDLDVFSFPNANALSAFSFTYPDTGYLFMNHYNFFTPNDSSQLIRVFDFKLVPSFGTDSMWIFNYQSLNLLFGDYVNDCKFFKNHTGYAVGPKGIVYRSADGGVTWANDYTGSNELFALSMTSENSGYAVSAGGTILKRGTATPVRPVESADGSLSIFPNPANSQTILSISVANEENATVRVMDINGKMCKLSDEIYLSKGNNHVPLNLSSLSQGSYVVTILTDHALLIKKLDVIR